MSRGLARGQTLGGEIGCLVTPWIQELYKQGEPLLFTLVKPQTMRQAVCGINAYVRASIPHIYLYTVFISDIIEMYIKGVRSFHEQTLPLRASFCPLRDSAIPAEKAWLGWIWLQTPLLPSAVSSWILEWLEQAPCKTHVVC